MCLPNVGDLVKNAAIDHVSCSFSIRDGKLRIERLTFESNNGPIDLTRVPPRSEFTPTQFQAVMACGS